MGRPANGDRGQFTTIQRAPAGGGSLGAVRSHRLLTLLLACVAACAGVSVHQDYDPSVDFNADGAIDGLDYLIMAQRWGDPPGCLATGRKTRPATRDCSSAAIPACFATGTKNGASCLPSFAM